jgi:hypothetical protein
MKDDGITTQTGSYMVGGLVTRGEMAAFLGRAFLGMQSNAPVTGIPSHLPVISNLQYSPQTATQNQGSGTVSVTGTINFTDQGGDITTLTINKYNTTGTLLSTNNTPVQNKSGVLSGSIGTTGNFNTATVENYRFEIYVTDLAGNSSNKLFGTFSVTAPPPTSEALIGNFKFVYQIISTWTDRITLDTKSDQKSSEGTDFYTGYNADYPSVTESGGAWSPSISKYIIVTLYNSSPYCDAYVFAINTDTTLPGCYMISNDYGSTWSDCYSFIIPASNKSPLGSWKMVMESQNDPIDINGVFKNKIAEDQKAQAQRTKSSSSVDGDLVSKINELKAMIKKPIVRQ